MPCTGILFLFIIDQVNLKRSEFPIFGLPHGPEFLCGRKFHGMREKKYFHTDENKVSYGWNCSFIRLKLKFHVYENRVSCV